MAAMANVVMAAAASQDCEEKDVEYEYSLEAAHEYASSSSSDSEVSDYEACDCVDTEKEKADKIPYVSIYEDPSEEDIVYFIPAIPVTAQIIDVKFDESSTRHMLNPHVYTIELQHGPFAWQVQRRHSDFQHLHHALQRYRIAQKMKAPVRLIRKRRAGKLEGARGEEYRVEEWIDDDDDKANGTRGRRAVDKYEMGGTLKHQDCMSPSGQSEGVCEAQPTDKTPRLSTEAETKKTRKVVEAASKFAGRDLPDVGVCRSRRHGRRNHYCHLPHFPITPERMIMSSPRDMEERRKELEFYLRVVLHVPSYRNHKDTAEFLEVSRLSFVNNLGAKSKEGLVKKRPGGQRTYSGVKRFCIAHCAKWSERWLLVKDSFVAYVHPRTEVIRAVMLFDKDFNIRVGAAETEGVKHGIMIQNLSRFLMVSCESHFHATQWKNAIMKYVDTKGHTWTQEHRFLSYAPPRGYVYSQWFVDGRTFMEHAANMLELAKEEIFITDWWLSPEIYMKRPMVEGNHWRLDQILKRKAELGVKIFVMLYKEVEVALGLNSMYSKRSLQALHPNIKVFRHPDHNIAGVFLWAHHEKIICIDQNIAFVGGIDLCYGRWDDYNHKLTDLGSVHLDVAQPETAIEYSLTSAFRSTAKPGLSIPLASSEDSEIPTPSVPSKLPHTPEEYANANKPRSPPFIRPGPVGKVGADVADGAALSRISGPTRVDMATLVKEFKTYVDSGQIEKEKVRASTPPLDKRRPSSAPKVVPQKLKSGWKSAIQKIRHREQEETAEEGNQYEELWRKLNAVERVDVDDVEGASKLWIGKDYVNFIFKDFTDLDLPFHDFIDRAITPRMPWHDISSVVYGSAARDVARHFIQRWNAVKLEKAKYEEEYPYLVPKSYDNVQIPRIFRNMAVRTNVQVLRSSCDWSAGMSHTENSIEEAYVDLISNAEHYIYIENQFFVTMIDYPDVTNRISQALYDRIVKAFRNQEKFRVYVLLPLLPAFEGQVGTPQGAALQVVLHWNYMSISKGPNALLPRLAKIVDDPHRFINFFSLRTFDDLYGKLVTEEVYIHSKLMIVDDKRCIIGSANVNDRSQLGRRDSEVCVCIEDVEFERCLFDGREHQAGRFCGSLRKHLFREHLGVLTNPSTAASIDVNDPISEQFFYNTVLRIASKNTDIYEKVFRCIPTDQVLDVAQNEAYTVQIPLAELNREASQELLAKIQGYLVLFPTRYLINSDLTPAVTTKEGLAPVALFV